MGIRFPHGAPFINITMKRLLLILGWILFVNIIDAGTTYYAMHNPIPVEEAGLLKNAENRSTDLAIIVHLFFSIIVLVFSFFIVKNYYDSYRKILAFRVFFYVLIIWAIFDTFVAINNILVIRQALL
jgi:hypothetical protein